MAMLLVILQLSFFYVIADQIETDFDTMAEAFCASGYGVSHLIVHKGKNRYNQQDYRFTLNCIRVTDQENTWKSCSTKYAIIIPHYQMDFDDQQKTCACNEYLAGVKTYLYELKENGAVVARERRFHLRCCQIPKSSFDLGSCQFTGMRSILTPWDTVLGDPSQNTSGNLIQSMMIFNNHMVARSCVISPAQPSNPYGISSVTSSTNDCEYSKGSKCNMMLNFPFPNAPDFSHDNSTENAIMTGYAYERQIGICKDGYYMSHLSKCKVNDQQGKDYVFDIECKPLAYHFCVSRAQCGLHEAEDTDVQWYVAGFKSDWDEKEKKRSFELLCCTSPALKTDQCETKNRIKDEIEESSKPQPHYKRKRRQAEKLIKNIVAQWENGSLHFSFDMCEFQTSVGKGCQEPCKTCVANFDPICNATIPIPNPSPVTNSLTVMTTIAATTTSTISSRSVNISSPSPATNSSIAYTNAPNSTAWTVANITSEMPVNLTTPLVTLMVTNTTSYPNTTILSNSTSPMVTNPTTVPNITSTLNSTIVQSTIVTTTPELTTSILTTTPTRPTCAAQRVDGAEFCKRKIPIGKNATEECEIHCYDEFNGHYRGANCIADPTGGKAKKLVCQCFYDPCRNSAMDIVFLLDSSGSLEEWGFQQEIDFLKNFVSRMTLGRNESRVALVQFSTGARTVFRFLDPVQSQDGVKKEFDKLYYDAGDTNITAAFVEAIPLLETTKRPAVPQVVVLVTDGIHNQGAPAPTGPASKLRSKGVLIYAVGIGPEASRNHLSLITGDRSNVFMAQFSDLNNVLNVIGAEVTATVNN